MGIFELFDSVFAKETLKEVDNEHYVMEITIDEYAIANDVRTYVDNKRRLIVQYYYKDNNKESSAIYKETLPEDADENQITAKLINGKLQVSIKKKESMD